MRADRMITPPGVFRVILAYIVVVNHALPLHFGSMAVYLFFMLSGYWVFVMWKTEYVDKSTPYRAFIISRFWRLLPIYYFSTLTFLVIVRLFPGDGVSYRAESLSDAIHYVVSQMLVLGYAPLPSAAKILPPVWSLDIEMQFYLVAPICIATLGAAWSRAVLFGVALAGVAALVLFYGGLRAQSGCLPMYLGFFLIGLYSAYRGWRPSPRLAVGGLATAVTVAAICLAIPIVRPLFVEGAFSTWLSDYNPDGNIVLAVLLAPYALATVRKSSHWLRFDRDLSNVTYEIYLLHLSAIAIVHHYVGGLSRYQQIPALALAAVLLFPVSWAVYRLIDRPIDRLRVAYVKSRSSQAARKERSAPVLAEPNQLPT